MTFFKTSILFWILFEFHSLKAQTFKFIDKFERDRYYPAFIYGTGVLKDTIIQNTGLRLTYHFNKAANSGFSLMRNYDVYLQDYSFMPDGFALTLKGGNNTDKIRFRLWEDINQNGKFDNPDEVFASGFHPLGDSSWHTIDIPIESFKRISGKGDDKLELNRIRAWDIEVESKNQEFHDGVLYVNNLKFLSDYQPKTSDKACLTGTFITLSKSDSVHNGYGSQQYWNAELMRMKRMHLDKLIIQYTVHQDQAWYSPCSLSFIRYQDAAINKIFVAAEKTGIKVFLGLYFDEKWFKTDKASGSTYSGLLKKDLEDIDELYRLFGLSTAFGGWYIPQEINDYDWMTDYKKQLLFSWLQEVASYAHKKDPSKPVIIAPYFNLWQPADILEDWYNDLLKVAPDIYWIYPQDGVGTTRKSVHIDIPHYGEAIKKACEKHGKKFGMTVEAFRQTSGWPLDNRTFSASSANSKEINEQIQEAYQLNPNDIIIFNWDYLPKP